ncbi:uncharacterized protein LOC142161767 isoform X3 [Nicotiana tabacum]|uniref:Uncharacterized protein LOC142161767 isoform X3 n=1 Tax=Nicotiana tabacum TaxID=4097 RepID=A0AC58TVP7_TOBAC
MYSGQRNKRPYAEHTNSDKNVRRRDIYGQILPDKKEAMLLQRLTKELERQKWNSSIKSAIDPDEKLAATMMLILSQVLLIREKMPLIRFLYLKEDQHRVHLRDNKICSPMPQAKTCTQVTLKKLSTFEPTLEHTTICLPLRHLV